jgi:hypothetical protein
MERVPTEGFSAPPEYGLEGAPQASIDHRQARYGPQPHPHRVEPHGGFTDADDTSRSTRRNYNYEKTEVYGGGTRILPSCVIPLFMTSMFPRTSRL